jgi:nicotinamide riboside transporter PnuC
LVKTITIYYIWIKKKKLLINFFHLGQKEKIIYYILVKKKKSINYIFFIIKKTIYYIGFHQTTKYETTIVNLVIAGSLFQLFNSPVVWHHIGHNNNSDMNLLPSSASWRCQNKLVVSSTMMVSLSPMCFPLPLVKFASF